MVINVDELPFASGTCTSVAAGKGEVPVQMLPVARPTLSCTRYPVSCRRADVPDAAAPSSPPLRRTEPDGREMRYVSRDENNL